MLLGSNGTVTAQALSQTGTWEAIGTATPGTVTKNVFTAWIDHGNTPSNGRYAYAVLPGANSATLDGYAAANPFTVLSNSPSIQAVRQASSGLTQIAFYEAGSLTIAPGFTVTVNKPCMLQVRELAGGNVELAVSEPKQTEAQVKVTVSRHLTGTGQPGHTPRKRPKYFSRCRREPTICKLAKVWWRLSLACPTPRSLRAEYFTIVRRALSLVTAQGIRSTRLILPSNLCYQVKRRALPT